MLLLVNVDTDGVVWSATIPAVKLLHSTVTTSGIGVWPTWAATFLPLGMLCVSRGKDNTRHRGRERGGRGRERERERERERARSKIEGGRERVGERERAWLIDHGWCVLHAGTDRARVGGARSDGQDPAKQTGFRGDHWQCRDGPCLVQLSSGRAMTYLKS